MGSIFSNGTKRKRCPLGTGSPWAPSNAPCRANTLRLKPQALEDFRAVQKCQVERNPSAQTSQDLYDTVSNGQNGGYDAMRNALIILTLLLSCFPMLYYSYSNKLFSTMPISGKRLWGQCLACVPHFRYIYSIPRTNKNRKWQNNLNLPNVRNPFTPVFMKPCIGIAFLCEMMLF